VDIPKEDITVYDIWVVACWYGNPYTNDPGSWSIVCGPYLLEEKAVLACAIRKNNAKLDDSQAMTLSDFIDLCNND
tara:strand:- start:857 stop:1084 length:228 start_codon:yes stop_codon:yes gene_type:complete